MVDWGEIKTEYITTETSYRKLAKKYGVTFSTLQKRATRENWAEDKENFGVRLVSVAVNKVSDDYAAKALKVQSVAGMLLDKIEEVVVCINPARGGKAVKDAADALKTVKDIMEIRCQADVDEQEARIAKLKKDLDEDKSKPVLIRFVDSEIESWGD